MTPPSAGPRQWRGGITQWLECVPGGLRSRPPGAQSDWLVAVERALGGLRIVGQNGVQLIARVDVQLREHLAQVILDGARAYEQPGGDVGVREPAAGELRDLGLLRCELVAGIGRAGPNRRAGREQLAA